MKITFFKKLCTKLTADEMFHETEVQANRLGSLILLCSGIILLLILLLTGTGVFPLSMETVFPPSIQAIVEIAILIILCKIVKNDAWWLKPLLLIGLVFVYARLDSMLTHKAAILMVIPVVFSSRYFSRKLTVFTALLSTLVFAGSAYWGATHGLINLNIVTLSEGTEMVATGGFLGDTIINAGVDSNMLIFNTLVYDYLPRWLMFSIVSVISCNIARRGRNMVVTQHEKDIKSARIESELNLSRKIQADMLPSDFPAFPERDEFDIYATMNPAKEVGGDFYDFFLIDDDHLCMVMADVSGKGIPAALFMMSSKIILANNAMMGKSPAQILTDTNTAICSNNREEMFITVWLGILEISTGKLTAANAGHGYPAIKHTGGNFELFNDKHGFVIGGIDGIKYKEYELNLEPGSKIFLYTDGVSEATDTEEEMFGTDRMLKTLNSVKDCDLKKTLESVHTAVNNFANGTEQLDDLTMLCFRYKGTDAHRNDSSGELEVEALIDNLHTVLNFVNDRLDEISCAPEARTKLELAVEEIFVNIANYAYPQSNGTATVRVDITSNPLAVIITFIDCGVPYDPLKREDPDTTLPANQREIGGLGIFLAKKSTDDIVYEYKDGRNILTLKKYL